MTTLIVLVSIIAALTVIVWTLGIFLFIAQKKAFEKAVQESDEQWEMRRKDFAQQVKDMDKRYEERKRQRMEGWE